MDQLSFTAVSAEANDEPLNTVSLEVKDPKLELEEPTEVESVVDLNASESVPIAEVPLDDSPVGSMKSMLTRSDSSSAALQSVSSNGGGPATASTSFCGVEGGGNHFVYLVDSSKSMGSAFESARRELIQAVESLQPQQRFYVIFFDRDSDYMRVSRSDMDDQSSILATSENKRAFRNWAKRIKMDSGKAPYDPLRFALNLRPDVIFLLSDGEFPARIEELLRSENRVKSLFDDDRCRCIVHTIGYHSQEGEERMRRIASENEGIYRYVPAVP